uniref:Uncharacterized protein n=1 Tax=Amphora coffeiformis TaxID=265554 RepID=A0A7S3L4T9_9STRA|mmetsp:Transcript_4010/g.8032  ORF Transcript_4010/g.8032 Transcript_4010/m.8032 type:complete len:143 (+) Transcript_4010:221-649(+)
MTMVSSASHQERFSEMTRMMFDRSMQQKQERFDQVTTTTPSPSAAGFPTPAGFPTQPSFPTTTTPPTPTPTTAEDKNSDFENAKPLIFLVLVLLLVCGGYKVYQVMRHRREQYLMRLRSVQADHVLGDMQMVPNEDPDAELL